MINTKVERMWDRRSALVSICENLHRFHLSTALKPWQGKSGPDTAGINRVLPGIFQAEVLRQAHLLANGHIEIFSLEIGNSITGACQVIGQSLRQTLVES